MWVSTDGTKGGYVIPKERCNINRNRARPSSPRFQKNGESSSSSDTSTKPLLFSVHEDDGGTSYFVVDHPIFSGVEGCYQQREIEEFYTDDMHHMVVRLLESHDKDSLRIDRRYMTVEDVEMKKHLAVVEFFMTVGVSFTGPINNDMYRCVVEIGSMGY